MVNSYNMQPKLHMSLAWSYCFSMIEISGALYHLEPTCNDIYLFWFFLLGLSSRSLFASNYSRFPTLSPLGISPLSLAVLIESLNVVTLYGRLLASPKSHILTWHFESRRIFAGLISLCITLQKCKNEMAMSEL